MKTQTTSEPTRAPATGTEHAASDQAATPEFAGWYVSSYELRQGLTVTHLDDIPPQAMFA